MVWRPTNGEIRVDGFDINKDESEAKRALACMPDVARFYTELTAWEHLRFLALAHGFEDGYETQAKSLLRECVLWGVAIYAHPPLQVAITGRVNISSG